MTALAADRTDVKIQEGQIRGHPVDGGSTIYKHALVCLNAAGYAVPAADTSGFSNVKGIAVAQRDNSAGSDGDLTVPVRSGISVNLVTSGADQSWEDNRLVYASDDQTVSTTAGNGIKVGYVEKFISATEIRVFIPLGGFGL